MNHTVSVYLYGRLRQKADCRDVTSECIVSVPANDVETIDDVLSHLGIEQSETSNIFLNGDLSAPSRRVEDGDRLGVFPSDMATLYKWYFAENE